MAVDPEAEALLAKNEAMMLALRSYAAECWTTITFPPGHRFQNQRQYQYSTLIAVKPNLMRYETWSLKKNPLTQRLERAQSLPDMATLCNGILAARQAGNQYTTDNKVAPEHQSTLLEPWAGFFTRRGALHSTLKAYREAGGTVHSLSLLPPEVVDGALCTVISYHAVVDPKASQECRGRLFLDRSGMVRRRIDHLRFSGAPGFTMDAVLRKIRKDFPPPAAQVFTYNPPSGVSRKVESKAKVKRPPVLANGESAPDFTVQDSTGKPMRLSDFKGKVVVLDFWATWCAPCMDAMPNTNRVGRDYREKEAVVLGINVWDEKSACMAWIKKNQTTYESMVFAHDPAGNGNKNIAASLFSVSGIPTQFVIDRSGIVRASFVGFNPDEAPLRKAIEAALRL